MRFIFKIIKILVVLFLLTFIGAGFYAGNTAYETLLAAPWEKILGITNHTKELDRIHRREEKMDGKQLILLLRMVRNSTVHTLRAAAIPNVPLFFFTAFIKTVPCVSLM